jgi:hypothetical protein
MGLPSHERTRRGFIEKRCPKCMSYKRLDAFTASPGRRHGRGGWCRECLRLYLRSGVKRRSLLKTTYGLTVEQYDRMLVEQHGVCAICGRPPASYNNQNKSLAVDHVHATGQVRGLLCGRCNTAIGLLREDPVLAVGLADYLRKWAP